MLFIDSVIERIGQFLEPPDFPLEKIMSPGNGEIVVSGVVLPKLVADQIQRLGISLSAYSTYELETAVKACAVDCTLIEDPDAPDFLDELEKKNREKEEDDDDDKKEEKEFDPYRLNRLYTLGDNVLAERPDERLEASYRERLKWERERKKQRQSMQKESPEEPRCSHG